MTPKWLASIIINFFYSERKSEEDVSSSGEQLASNKIYRLEWSEGSHYASLPCYFRSRSFMALITQNAEAYLKYRYHCIKLFYACWIDLDEQPSVL